MLMTLKTLDCGSPAIDNGNYMTLLNKEILEEGATKLLPYSVKYSCKEGYAFASPASPTGSTCNGESGNFEPEIVCLKGKKNHLQK